MATYTIHARKRIYLEIEVEASSLLDARRIADELITDDFTEVNTDFQIVDVERNYRQVRRDQG